MNRDDKNVVSLTIKHTGQVCIRCQPQIKAKFNNKHGDIPGWGALGLGQKNTPDKNTRKTFLCSELDRFIHGEREGGRGEGGGREGGREGEGEREGGRG